MAFKDLTSKLKKGILAATVGLASLAYAPKADGQVMIDAEVRHVGSNQVVTGTLQEGEQYVINLNVENISSPEVQQIYSELLSTFRLNFGNGFTPGEAVFTYAQTSPDNGNPLVNDLFSTSTGVSNTYQPIQTGIDYAKAQFERSVTGNFPTLDYGEKANIATFLITPGSGSAGGSLSLTFDSLTPSGFDILDDFGSSYDVQFFQGANQIDFNIQAIPEPSTYALFAGGAALAGAAAYGARRRRENSKK